MSAQHAPMSTDLPPPRSGKGLSATAGILMALGVALLLATPLSDGGTARLGYAYLLGFTFAWSIVLGSLCFVGLQHLTHSIWSVVVRRVAEILASPIWVLGLLFLPILVMACWTHGFQLYPWADAGQVQHDVLLQKKQAYLNAPFFTIRAVVFFGLWMGFASYFVRTSLRQDRGEAGPEASLAMRRASVAFMLVFAVTVSFAGIDWLMSLEPRWFSTIFGVYVFSGMFVAALAAITLLVLWLDRAGRLGRGLITRDHLYNLGALQFAFVCFWAYIAFSQYMLIWYANLPEESFYLFDRLSGRWLGVSVALALVRFVIPFLLLLSRRAKMNPAVLLWVSIILLVGQLLDLYWLIMPAGYRAGPVFGWQELGPLLLMTGLLLWSIGSFLKRHLPVAVGDPLLEQSRSFRL